MMRRQNTSRDREIPIEIIQEILVRLRTKDLVRSSCVSRLWRSIVVGDASFRKRHDADHVAAAAASESEALLVSESRVPGRRDEASILSLGSGKAMCHVAIPSGYGLTNVCNGFLCFALDHDEAPAVVCNPVTGETLELPKAPPLSVSMGNLFVLGFSPPTKEYKMFRVSWPHSYSWRDDADEVCIAVYTLGGGGGWRQYSYASRFFPRLMPVHIDGKLYVAAADLHHRGERATQMLVIDVATETHSTYRLPYNYQDYHSAWNEMLATGFDLNGQMCLAVNAFEHIFQRNHRRKLQFWVMTPPGEHEVKDDGKLYWDLRYSFYVDEGCVFDRQKGAWIEHAGQMLCYRHHDYVYKHDITLSSSNVGVDSNNQPSFDHKLQLPEPPLPLPSAVLAASYCRWNVCGGYRPSLLSPLVFASPPPAPDDNDETRQFEQTLLRALTQI